MLLLLNELTVHGKIISIVTTITYILLSIKLKSSILHMNNTVKSKEGV